MSDLIDEFVTELIETGSTGSKDNPDYVPPMYKRTPGQWTWEYDPEKQGHALCVDPLRTGNGEVLQPTIGDMQLMSYAAVMNSLLWKLAEEGMNRKAIIYLLAKIDVEPDADLNIPEELISEVKASRNTRA